MSETVKISVFFYEILTVYAIKYQPSVFVNSAIPFVGILIRRYVIVNVFISGLHIILW